MVLDSSAVFAILLQEPECGAFLSLLYGSDSIAIAAPTVLECQIVALALFGAEGEVRLDAFLRTLGAEIVPFGEGHLAVARAAFRDFGKGRHSASLNFGDCFSYALAVLRDESLLFKGDDFNQTDVRKAVMP